MCSSRGPSPCRLGGCPIRRSSDQCLVAAPRCVSPLPTSFIGTQCQGIHRMPSVLLLLSPVMPTPPSPRPTPVLPMRRTGRGSRRLPVPHQPARSLGGTAPASAQGVSFNASLSSPPSKKGGPMRRQRTRRVVSSVVKVQNPPPPLQEETDPVRGVSSDPSPTVYPLPPAPASSTPEGAGCGNYPVREDVREHARRPGTPEGLVAPPVARHPSHTIILEPGPGEYEVTQHETEPHRRPGHSHTR